MELMFGEDASKMLVGRHRLACNDSLDTLSDATTKMTLFILETYSAIILP